MKRHRCVPPEGTHVRVKLKRGRGTVYSRVSGASSTRLHLDAGVWLWRDVLSVTSFTGTPPEERRK